MLASQVVNTTFSHAGSCNHVTECHGCYGPLPSVTRGADRYRRLRDLTEVRPSLSRPISAALASRCLAKLSAPASEVWCQSFFHE